MGLITFECLKCGTCCKKLLEEYKGILVGTFLTIKEKDLFPPELIFPRYAFGKVKPENIVAYQLTADTCPCLSSDNRCKIYHKRPLACQSFPQEIMPFSNPTVSCKCIVIGSQMRVDEFREVEFSSGTEIRAATKMANYLKNRYKKFYKKGVKLWEFDLRTKNWILKPQPTSGANISGQPTPKHASHILT